MIALAEQTAANGNELPRRIVVYFDGRTYKVVELFSDTKLAETQDRKEAVATSSEAEVRASERLLRWWLEHERHALPADHPAIGSRWDPLAARA